MTEALVVMVIAVAILFCFIVHLFNRVRELEDQQTCLLKTWVETNRQVNLHAVDLNHKNVTLYGTYGTLKEKS